MVIDRYHGTHSPGLGLASTKSRTWLWFWLWGHIGGGVAQGHLSLRKQHLVMLVHIAITQYLLQLVNASNRIKRQFIPCLDCKARQFIPQFQCLMRTRRVAISTLREI